MSVFGLTHTHSVFYGLSLIYYFHNSKTSGDRKKRTSDSDFASNNMLYERKKS